MGRQILRRDKQWLATRLKRRRDERNEVKRRDLTKIRKRRRKKENDDTVQKGRRVKSQNDERKTKLNALRSQVKKENDLETKKTRLSERSEKTKEIEAELADSGDEGDAPITVFAEKYTVGEILGRGAFSTVKEVTSKRSGRKYAVKIIDKKNVGQDMQRLRTEIEILTRVKHPNIINLKEIMEDDDTLYIITELVTGGELFDKIVELGAYTEADAA